MTDTTAIMVAAAVGAVLLLALLVLTILQGRTLQRLRLIAEQARSGNDSEGETTRRHVTDSERALRESISGLRAQQAEKFGEHLTLLARGQEHLRAALVDERDKTATHAEGARTLVETRLRELGTQQADGATTLATLLAAGQTRLAGAMAEERDRATLQADATRTLLDTKLRELRDSNDAKLAQIEKTANEQLHQAVEQQMTACT